MQAGSSAVSSHRRSLAYKRVALFCHLARMLWKLSCRIEWRARGWEEYRKVDGVRAMLGRAEARARLSRPAEEGERA